MPSTPLYDVFCDRRLIVVRLREASPEAAMAVGEAVARRFEEIGELLFYVALVGPDAETPDVATRKAILDTLDRQFDKMMMMRIVMFGSGTKVTIIRSVTTVMVLTMGISGRRIHVDKHLRATAAVVAEKLGYDPDEVIDRVVARGLLTREEAG